MNILETFTYDDSHFDNMHTSQFLDEHVSPVVKHLSNQFKHIEIDDHHSVNTDHPNTDPLHTYTKGQGSHSINSNLIYGEDPEKKIPVQGGTISGYYQSSPKELSDHIQKHSRPLEQPLHVYSGIGGTLSRRLKEGGKFHSPAFLSTTVSPAVTGGFGTGSDILHIELPEGYKKGIYIGHVSPHPENEFLLDKDQHFEITHWHEAKTASGYPINVYHAKPIDRHLTEATYHDINAFRTVLPRNFKLEKTLKNHFNNVAKVAKKEVSKDATAQHKKLEKSASGKALTKERKGIQSGLGGEYSHIRDYTDDSRSINSYHLAKHNVPEHSYVGNSDYNERYTKNLDSELEKHKYIPDHEMHVYSGIGFVPSKKGDIVHFPAYTSTSLNPEKAKEFASMKRNEGYTDEYHIVHFKLPIGYEKGTYVTPIAYHRSEKEYLLHRDQKFRITGHKVVNTTEKHLSTQGQRLVRNKLHIWTMEPHTEDLKEAYYHRPSVFDHNILDNSKRDYIGTWDRALNDRQAQHLSNVTKEKWDQVKHLAPKEFRHYNYNGWDDKTHNYPIVYKAVSKQKDVNRYTSNSFFINKRLMKTAKHNNETQRTIDGLRSISAPLKQETHVYSNLGTDVKGTLSIGKMFKTPTFTSTSIDASMAHSWKHPDNGESNHILHFILPKGFDKGAYVADHSEYRHEREYLIHPKQKWVVVDHSEHYNPYTEKTYNYDKREYEDLKHNHTTHVWSVIPFDKQKHKHLLKEAYNNNHSNAILQDTKDLVPAVQKIQNRDYVHEHNHLSTLHDHIGAKYHDAIQKYSMVAHPLNEGLIENGKPNPFFSKLHSNLQAMFKETPALTREHHVYSGMGTFDPGTLIKNDKIHLPAYTSTSINPEVAVKHSNLKGFADEEDQHVLHFMLPVGYNQGHYIANHSKFKGEMEMVLNHGQTFDVVGKKSVPITTKLGNFMRHIWSVKPSETKLKEHLIHDEFAQGLMTNTIYNSGKSYSDIGKERKIRNEAVKEIVPSIKPGHKNADALYQYSGFDSYHLNKGLIAGQLVRQHDMEIHKGIQNVMSEVEPLKTTLHVYSGTGSWNPKVTTGDILHTKAYTSTSIDPHRAAMFTDRPNDNHVIHFELPEGFKRGQLIDEVSEHPGEKEYLLDHNQHWKVTAHTIHEFNDKTKLHIYHVVPHDISLNEAFIHDPKVFKTWNRDVYKSTKHNPKRDKLSDRLKIKVNNDVHNVYKTATDTWAHPSLEDHEAETVHSYTKAFGSPNRKKWHSKVINSYILNPDADRALPEGQTKEEFHNELQHNIEHLDHIIRKHAEPVHQELHVYSGIGDRDVSDLNVGSTVHLPTFTSTSIDPQQAKEFNRKSKVDNTVLHFKLPVGYKGGLAIAHHSRFNDEQEYLINRNSTWKVTNRESKIYSDTCGERKSHRYYNKYHIITLEPHEDYLKENLDWFRNYEQTSSQIMSEKPGLKKFVKTLDNLKFEKEQHVKKLGDELWTHHDSDLSYDSHIRNYTGTASTSINYGLIEESQGKKLDSDIKHHSDNISKEISHVGKPLHKPIDVYSGISSDVKNLLDNAHEYNNGVVHLPAFTSTSINPTVAQNHSSAVHNPKTDTYDSHVLHFKLPESYSKGAYVEQYSVHPYEKEFLLDKNQKFKITGKTTKNVITPKDTIFNSKKYIHRVHIWTLEPHTENHLKEAYEHDPDAFKPGSEFMTINSNDHQQFLASKQRSELIINGSHLGGMSDQGITNAVGHYKSWGSRGINQALIDPTTSNIHHEKYITELSNKIKQSTPITEDLHVYSGLNINKRIHNTIGVGNIIHTPAFTSTTLHPHTAQTFAQGELGLASQIVHFHLPKGYSKGAVIHNNDYDIEHEFLLDKDQKWKVIGHKEYKDSKFGITSKTHVISVVPHNENETLKEAVTHNPNIFRQMPDSSKIKINSANQTKLKSIVTNAYNFTDTIAQHNRLQNHYDFSKVEHPDYKFQLKAINSYTDISKGYNSILLDDKLNKNLHVYPHIGRISNIIHHMNEQFGGLPEDVHTYSGVGNAGAHPIATAKKGDIIHLPAFTSTSILPTIATNHHFMQKRMRYETERSATDSHLLHFKLPSGYKKGLYIDEISLNSGEKELLLDKNTKWKITDQKRVTRKLANSRSYNYLHIHTLEPHED